MQGGLGLISFLVRGVLPRIPVRGHRLQAAPRLAGLPQPPLPLCERGWVEGHTSATEWRWAEGGARTVYHSDCRSVRLPVEVLVVPNARTAQIAKQVTTTSPIVVVRDGALLEMGLIASLAQLGGNITGVHTKSPRDCSEAAGTAQAGSAQGDSRGGARRSVLAKIATAGGGCPSVGDGAAERPAWCGVSRNAEVRRQTDGDSWNGLFDTQTGPKAGGSSLSISRAFFISQIISAGCVNKHTVEKQAGHALCLDQHALSA